MCSVFIFLLVIFTYNTLKVFKIVCVCISEEEIEPLISFTESTSSIFLRAVNPIDSRSWRRIHWSWKVLKAIQVKHYSSCLGYDIGMYC